MNFAKFLRTPFLQNMGDYVLSLSFLYNYKKLSLYKNLFLIKSVYLLDTFLGRFFMKPKLNKYFPCFCYDIYFKNNLGLPLDFKVINVKNLYSKNLKGKFKYCNVNIFQLLNFCNCRISYFGSNIFVISYLCKKRLNRMSLFFLFSSLFGKILQLHAKVSIGEESMY